MEVLRPGVESELQLPAYATVTATCDPSCNCGLHHSSQQCQILNLMSEARGQTHILMDTSWVCDPLSHNGNSWEARFRQIHIIMYHTFSKLSHSVLYVQRKHSGIFKTSSIPYVPSFNFQKSLNGSLLHVKHFSRLNEMIGKRHKTWPCPEGGLGAIRTSISEHAGHCFTWFT